MKLRGNEPSRRAVACLLTSCAIAASACTPLVATNGGAAPAPNGATIEQAIVRVGEFAAVRAIAVAPARAFVLADGGLAIYDRARRAWVSPLALAVAGDRGFTWREPCAAAANLIGDAVWIACGTQVTVVRPAIGAVWAIEIGAPISALAVSRSGGDAWVFAGGGAAVVSASGTARGLAPGETIPPDRLANRMPLGGGPALGQEFADPLLLRDDALRVWQPTAASRGEGAGEVWVGTSGGGVFLADIDFHRSRQLPFGLRSGRVRFVSRTATGVIVAEDPLPDGGDRSVITTASDDLAQWSWPSLYTSLGALSAMVTREGTICLAGELGAGMANLTPLHGDRSTPLNNDHRVFEPARTAIGSRRGCVIGTDQSVIILPWPSVDNDSIVESRTLGSLPPVRSLAASRDTLWIGTRGGLYRFDGFGGEALPVRLPASIAADVVALALTAEGIAIAGPSELWLGSGAGRTAALTRPVSSVGRVGRLTTLAADASTLWIGGTNGLLAIALPSGESVDVALDDRATIAPPPIGGRDVRSIALAPGVAWVGTAAGLVRIRRGVNGLPR